MLEESLCEVERDPLGRRTAHAGLNRLLIIQVALGRKKGARRQVISALGPHEATHGAVKDHGLIKRVLILIVKLIERTELEGSVEGTRGVRMISLEAGFTPHIRASELWVLLRREMLDEVKLGGDLREVVHLAD